MNKKAAVILKRFLIFDAIAFMMVVAYLIGYYTGPTRKEVVQKTVYLYRDGYTIAGEGATVYVTMQYDGYDAMECVRPECDYVEVLATYDSPVQSTPDVEDKKYMEVQ